jgi:Tfp pilus assembly protein PilF
MGWVLYRLGRLAEARVQLERAVDLTGGDPIVCEHLGDVYKDLKLNDLARKLYRRSLEKDSSNSRVRAKLEEE